MNILYEDSMPFAEHFFADLGQCQAFSSGAIQPEDIADTHVLLVRSTTKVNQSLLHLAKNLKYVATATAGSDHLDKNYLDSHALPWGSAAGCNAVAVAEYVLSCMFNHYYADIEALQNKTVGIVGAGHVGSALQKRLQTIGIQTLLCDPPLEQTDDPRRFSSLDDICQCDVISLHVPLIVEGEHPTFHMFDAQRLAALKPEQLLINACRGEVLNNQAALALYRQGKKLNLMLDVWENEPNIDFNLVNKTLIATAHIAGHTLEGKARGTYMLYQQVCERFGHEQKLSFESCLPPCEPLDFSVQPEDSPLQQVKQVILATYDVKQDSHEFKGEVKSAAQFVYSRKHYAIRREFASVPLKTGNFAPTKAIYDLGFQG
ncbi:4-phosphoerythronate dehydrogenase [Aliiglaciecola sp. LCG003]|uniref:4-phosphoerythronate dehydrogenase n=1 Tax=Aliiglaciecola sp. LCG003 TaxID=3053655 RepID=UPI0025729AA6|nr:4-phosphoerythronate dehydrogenase [Aliiglaciecola sp. LCG003]WJG08293.1 4-phosphoerythronate dehydrogenase [Aliiglaciecola sp. LCG003]